VGTQQHERKTPLNEPRVQQSVPLIPVVFHTGGWVGYELAPHTSIGRPSDDVRSTRGVRPVVGFRESREMRSERDRWGVECGGWPVESALEAKGLSSGHISPVCVVRWLSGGGGVIYIGGRSDENHGERLPMTGGGLTSSNALPDIDAFSFWIPNATLCVEIPVDVDLPDPGSVADYGGHR
jgi:hypothetical protein